MKTAPHCELALPKPQRQWRPWLHGEQRMLAIPRAVALRPDSRIGHNANPSDAAALQPEPVFKPRASTTLLIAQ